MSTTKPANFQGHILPPTLSRLSRMMCSIPFAVNSLEAPIPEIPAPKMMTSCICYILLNLQYQTTLSRQSMQTFLRYAFTSRGQIPISPPLLCKVEATYLHSRALNLTLPHGEVHTPVFMPVATKAAIKGITFAQLKNMGCKILLSNTYHLGSQPGSQYIQKVGGLHVFENWDRNILTDSGGFQMVSFGDLSKFSEEGVQFSSPYGGETLFVAPEDSIKMQNQIGADIMMALDDVVRTSVVDDDRFTQSTSRTTRWLHRCMQAHSRPKDQVLFPIVQGGITPQLRVQSLEDLIKVDAYGYAIGGLSGGQNKLSFFKIVKQCCEALPANKPRYLMGVGYPIDLVLCSALGVDMFDCIFPSRTARFGSALTSRGQLKLKNNRFQNYYIPIQEGCKCQTCQHYTRAYLSLIRNEDNFCHLLTIHNIHHILNLMTQVREAIRSGELECFVQKFINDLYSQEGAIPSWVIEALQMAQIRVKLEHPISEYNS